MMAKGKALDGEANSRGKRWPAPDLDSSVGVFDVDDVARRARLVLSLTRPLSKQAEKKSSSI